MKKLILALVLLATPAFAQGSVTGDGKSASVQTASKKPAIEDLQTQLKQARAEAAGYHAMADTFRAQAQNALDQLAQASASLAMQKATEAK